MFVDRWERWGTGRAVMFTRPLAVLAVSRLAKELYGDRPRRAAGALARVAAGPVRPAADAAFSALAAACDDPRVAGAVIHESLLQCPLPQDSRDHRDDRSWSAVAAPLLFGGSPPRLVRFLGSAPDADDSWLRPERIVDQLVGHLSGGTRRRPELERFLSTTDHPLVLAKLAALWGDDTFLPGPGVTDVTMANPHLVPPASGANVLLAVAKDRLDLIDFTRPGTVDVLVRGTGLHRADLADKYRRVLRALPPGVARERLCEIVVHQHVGAGEAAAAAIEAGYVPERQRDRVLFLYLSKQWDRYDEIDPDGELLYAAYLDVHNSTESGAIGLAWYIAATARRNGRPDPAARYRAEHPEPEATTRQPRRGPAGGYSSDYGSHHDGGGGWTGGSFHA